MRWIVLAIAVAVSGVLSAAPAQAQWAATAYIDNDVAGDVQSGRLGVGASAGFYLRGRLGLELDGEMHGHFFRDESVASLVGEGVDLNTKAALGFANVIAPYCLRGPAGTWCPYATVGLGLVHAIFDGVAHAPGAENLHRTQNDLALNAGVGVMHALTRWIGLRVDARYIHAFVDDPSKSGGYFQDYGYCRLAVGITFGGPAGAP
jgi:hypothetical protein